MREHNSTTDVLVIGGGAAGFLAAIAASSRGLSVTVLDRFDPPLRKLLISGKGRCNLTNAVDVDSFLRQFPRGGRFLYSSVTAFSPDACMRFFEEKGLPLVVERGNRVFPESGRAGDVAETLMHTALEQGVKSIKGRAVSVEREGDGFLVRLPQGSVYARAVILATGGLSYPKTGSDGDGYRFAASFGHHIRALRPSLVPIELVKPRPDLMGLSLRNVRLSAQMGERLLFAEMGEMLFTHFGISGPLVLRMSASLVDIDLRKVRCSLDLKPALSERQLDRRVLKDLTESHARALKNSLAALLPKALIPFVIAESGLDPNKKAYALTAPERKELVRALKEFPLPMAALRPIEEAVVTAGGVALDEIDPKTMESKRAKNLHIVGELLDLDGYTGGFNLGAAFATGHAAGRAVLSEPKADTKKKAYATNTEEI